MSTEIKKEIQLEIAHVLFLDSVGYSKLSVNEQHAQVEELNEIVRLCEQFRKAEAANEKALIGGRISAPNITLSLTEASESDLLTANRHLRSNRTRLMR